MYFVRVAKGVDAPRIARIRANTSLGPISGTLLAARTIKRREAFWRERLEQGTGTVFLIESDEIVGICDLVPSRDKAVDSKTISEISTIYVLSDSWKQGAGRVLCSYALAEARKRGHKAVTVWVLASSSDAMRFYESLGFARDGGFKVETAHDGSNLQQLRYRATI